MKNILRYTFIIIWLSGTILMMVSDPKLIVIGLLLSLLTVPVIFRVLRDKYGDKIIDEYIFKALSYIFYICVIAIGLIGFGIIIYQIFIYLKTEAWQSISIISLLSWIDYTWATNPNDWHGLWKILNHMPLSVTFIAFAIGILYEKLKTYNA